MTPLSEVELKILGILGQTFYEGIGRQENGIRIISYLFCTSLLIYHFNAGLIESEIILQNSPEPMSLNTPNEEIDTNLIGECSKGGAVKECSKTGTIQR